MAVSKPKHVTLTLVLTKVSPTLQKSISAGLSAKNAFGGRRYTEVSPSIVAGIKMREQQEILKDQMQKNLALENRIKRLAFE